LYRIQMENREVEIISEHLKFPSDVLPLGENQVLVSELVNNQGKQGQIRLIEVGGRQQVNVNDQTSQYVSTVLTLQKRSMIKDEILLNNIIDPVRMTREPRNGHSILVSVRVLELNNPFDPVTTGAILQIDLNSPANFKILVDNLYGPADIQAIPEGLIFLEQ